MKEVPRLKKVWKLLRKKSVSFECHGWLCGSCPHSPNLITSRPQWHAIDTRQKRRVFSLSVTRSQSRFCKCKNRTPTWHWFFFQKLCDKFQQLRVLRRERFFFLLCAKFTRNVQYPVRIQLLRLLWICQCSVLPQNAAKLSFSNFVTQ